MVSVVNHTKISLLFDNKFKIVPKDFFFQDFSLQSRQLARTGEIMNVVKLSPLEINTTKRSADDFTSINSINFKGKGVYGSFKGSQSVNLRNFIY